VFRRSEKKSGILGILVLAAFLMTSSVRAQAGFVVDLKEDVEGDGANPVECSLEVTRVVGSELALQTAGTGGQEVSPYLKVNFTDNHLGDQVLLIFTENQSSPTGSAPSRGLVNQSDATVQIPVDWAATDAPQQGGYRFSSVNLSAGSSSQSPVVNRSENPFPLEQAFVATEVRGNSAVLGSGPQRGQRVEDGEIYVYLAPIDAGAPPGNYATRLKVQLATRQPDGSLTPLVTRSVVLRAVKQSS
jgi:hypothetical protein